MKRIICTAKCGPLKIAMDFIVIHDPINLLTWKFPWIFHDLIQVEKQRKIKEIAKEFIVLDCYELEMFGFFDKLS